MLNSLRSLLATRFVPGADEAAAPVLIESLEHRLVPSASVATGDFNGNGFDDLKVKINDPHQHLTITEDDLAGTTTVAIDADGDGRFDGAGDFFQVFNEVFDGVKVKLFGGADRFDYLLASDMANVGHDFNFKLGGSTDNTINFDAQGHGITQDTAASLRVSGGGGFNAVNLNVDAVDNAALSVGLTLSGPSNLVNVNVFGAVQDHSLVQVNVLTGPGANAGGNVINLAALGGVDHSELDLRADGSADSGAAHDVINVQLAGAVDHHALLQVTANIYRGGDEAHIEVAQGTFGVLDHSAASLTAQGSGDGGQTLSVNGDGGDGTLPIDSSSRLDILIHGSNGSDNITSDFSAVNALRLDGEFILAVTADRGNDQINVGLANTTDSFGLYDVTLRGEQGNDHFSVFVDDPSGNAVAYDSSDLGYPTGYVIVAGGSGLNSADVFGNVALININA